MSPDYHELTLLTTDTELSLLNLVEDVETVYIQPNLGRLKETNEKILLSIMIGLD